MKISGKSMVLLALILSSLMLYGCSANVGVGLNVGVPIGDHGYISLGTGRWH